MRSMTLEFEQFQFMIAQMIVIAVFSRRKIDLIMLFNCNRVRAGP